MTTKRYHVIVLGSGIESLVAAGYLGKAGLDVLLVDGAETVGGTLITSEAVPGFRFDACLDTPGYLSPEVVADLALAHHGLKYSLGEPRMAAPRPGEQALRLSADPEATAHSVRQASPGDADQWPAFSASITTLAGFLADMYRRLPPRPGEGGVGDLMTILRLAVRGRGLGRVALMEFLRTFPMPVSDLLDDWFEDDLLKGALGVVAVRHLALGPRSAGTAFGLLHQQVGATAVPRGRPIISGGVGHLAWALEVSARERGVEFRTGTTIAQILVDDEGTSGVVLDSGEEISARAVMSGYDVRRTFFDLIDPVRLDPEFVAMASRIRYRGVAAKVNLALGELPDFTGLDATDLHGTVMLCPSLDSLERAYDHTKYGEVSDHPALEVVVPSVSDPSLAPEGGHVLSAWLHYAPFHRRDGTWGNSERDALGDLAVQTLQDVAPNVASAIVGREVLTPLDLQSRFGLSEGQVFQGEVSLDQILFMRPIPGWSHYRTPIDGLYLCGPATHPGGGITGESGRLAARQMVRDRKRLG
jgi:phytoene dehydrogenase-like protein